jgi:predicted secreted protein
MKNILLVALMLLSLLLSAAACSAAQGTTDTNATNNKVPPAPNKYLISISGEDFSKQANIAKQIEVNPGYVFTVALDSNATTGYQWTPQANIADINVLAQTAHQYIEPRVNGSEKPVSGMAGIEEWTFRANQTGTTTVRLSYDRPWEGGEKSARTFELTVVVK